MKYTLLTGLKTRRPGLIRSSILSIAIFLLSMTCFAQVISVKQDSTGDFTSIQPAIDFSQNGDTVLVYPGTYFENLNFHGKSITLGSLNLTTNDPSYIHQTVIDGNFSESCLKVISGETVEITGFKITHGSGDTEFFERGDGAGIFTYNSTVSVINCLITENDAWGYGGGINNAVGLLYLSGTTICHNHAKHWGGGLFADCVGSNIIFDSISRCNIYLNFAGNGCDIFNPDTSLRIILDTFTVLNPDRYHIQTTNGLVPDTMFSFDALHSKIDTAASDLYVNPSGNDENDGLSADQPLKTLAFALTKIVTSPEQNRKIFLSDGVYSKNTNGEKFPINIRSYIDIIGEGESSTIFDADSTTYFFQGNEMINRFLIKNIQWVNGNGEGDWEFASGAFLVRSNNGSFENLYASNGTAVFSGCMYLSACNNIFMKNFVADSHTGGFGTIRMGNAQNSSFPYTKDTITFINCRIENSMPSPEGVTGGNGTAIRIGGPEPRKDTAITVYMIGCEIIDNTAISTPPLYAVSGIAMFGGGCVLNLVNSTIGNNNPANGGNGCAIGFGMNTHLNIYNSIIYGNWPPQITEGGYDPSDTSTLNIYHSLIQGGENGILVFSPWHQIYYDPTNINTDPFWDTASLYPYSLSAGSPCIDAGTLNLPPGIELPEYDIAGNPRIWGESVDMGAYEYGPWVRVPEASPVGSRQSSVVSHLNISPNPFEYGTYIRYELQEKGRLNISVYSLSGRKVKTLIHSSGLPGETGKFYWDGHDAQGNALPAGTYIIRMTVEDRLVEAVKVVRG